MSSPPMACSRQEDGALTFHAERAPSRDEIAGVAGHVAKRMTKWLRRRRLLDERPEEERSNEAPDLSPLEACMQLSLFGGTFLPIGKAANDVEDDHRRVAKSPWTAEVDGFNVHAGITVEAGDRQGLERLCRYGARPPFSLERLSILADGRVAYLLHKLCKNRATHLVPCCLSWRRCSVLLASRRSFRRLAFHCSASRESSRRAHRGAVPSSRCGPRWRTASSCLPRPPGT